MSAFIENEQPLSTKQIQMFITETCPLACNSCPYPLYPLEKKQRLKAKEMSPEKWNSLTDFLYNQGAKLFCVIGGEPVSYEGVEDIIAGIAKHPDAITLLSTSGIHLVKDPDLRQKIGEVLALPRANGSKNGVAVSFDEIPGTRKAENNARAFKARKGLEAIRLLKREFDSRITYTANTMVTPGNLGQILAMQSYLENEGVYMNLCTQQGKCFGKKDAVFGQSDIPLLTEVSNELVARKVNGGLLVPSASYLSQLPGVIGFENYKCWNEPQGSPVLDIGPNGDFRYCNWIGQDGEPPAVNGGNIINGKITWDEFFGQSTETTRMLCSGCSWSRRDRNLELLVIHDNTNLGFDPNDPKLLNIWA